jgi:DNA-binding transcriptional ArsR family regulator
MFRPSLRPFFDYAVMAEADGLYPIDHALASAELIRRYHLKPSEVAEVFEAAFEVVTPTAYPSPLRQLQAFYYAKEVEKLVKGSDLETPEARQALLERLEALAREEAQLGTEWQVRGDTELLALADQELEWDIEGLLPHRTLGIIAGPPKSGKSFLALDLALALASGQEFLGFPCYKRRVLLVEEEDSDFRLSRRLKRLMIGRGLEGGLPLHCLIRQGVRIDERPSLEKLYQIMLALGAEVLILDVFRRLWGGDENSQSEVQPVLNDLARLAERCNATILLLHHTRKSQPDRRKNKLPIEEISGSGALGAWSEITLALEPKGDALWLTVISKDAGTFTHLIRLAETEAAGLVWEDLGEPEELGSKKSQEAKERYLQAIAELGSPTVKELAGYLGLSPQAVRRYLRSLEEGKLVQLEKAGREMRVRLRGSVGETKPLVSFGEGE